jgi:hypothetical protein
VNSPNRKPDRVCPDYRQQNAPARDLALGELSKQLRTELVGGASTFPPQLPIRPSHALDTHLPGPIPLCAMFRTAPRALARQSALRALPRTANAALPAGRRALSTAPPAQKSRSWKSLFARLGAAGAVIYYYNTTDVFGDEARRTSDRRSHASEQRAETW